MILMKLWKMHSMGSITIFFHWMMRLQGHINTLSFATKKFHLQKIEHVSPVDGEAR